MFFFNETFFLREVLGPQENWMEGTGISHISSAPLHMDNLPIINMHQHSGIFVIVAEPTLIHHHHQLKPVGFTLNTIYGMDLDKCMIIQVHC